MEVQKSITEEKKENNEDEGIEIKTILGYLKDIINKHKKSIIIFILGMVVTIIITTIISPILATIIPSIDKERPEIIEVTPLTNSNLFNLSNISVKVSDSGGSGLDLESSFLILSGAYSGEINVTKKIKDDLIIFTPIEELKPDMYTAEFFIKDKGGNLKTDFTRFTIFEKPKLRFDFYEAPLGLSENDIVNEIKWKASYIPYSFGIANEGSTVTLEDIELTFDFPGVILDHNVMAKTSCVNCNIIESQSKPLIVQSGKTEKNFSTCQLIIDIERLPPGGIFSGTIFIDPQYTPKTNEVLVFCDDKIAQRSGEFNLSQNLTISAWVKYSGGVKYKYHGNYFFEQLGWVHNRSIEGEINMSGDAWINKGIYLRNMGLNYNFQPTEDVKNSIDSFNNAIKIDENSSIAWNEKGISLAYLGNFSGAFQSFDRSISINPNFDKPYYHIALMYLKIGNCGIATNYAKKALKINPDSINSSRLIESCSNINIVAPEIIRNVWSAPLKVDR